jgi:hypothetical protein
MYYLLIIWTITTSISKYIQSCRNSQSWLSLSCPYVQYSKLKRHTVTNHCDRHITFLREMYISFSVVNSITLNTKENILIDQTGKHSIFNSSNHWSSWTCENSLQAFHFPVIILSLVSQLPHWLVYQLPHYQVLLYVLLHEPKNKKQIILSLVSNQR